ncbi:MBL fold metallo-hydrolase [Streptomyces purpurogeneiscleroticus]|uniref:MBL fold metallo-hydrolase n=1 Tax=Streptomyces purpurogeneiscleroticus TaxID=68259 RepID=UPI001CBE9A6F|nr:MBL fold metallo-hydrolase [Streptomyces purpurogeneiscleroticus]MBZ4015628.1 MBL fold metallo-hydrolase [Streptomyces purpurogeneiscleroticus]
MRPRQLTSAIWQLPFPVGHVYVVRLPPGGRSARAGYALVDTGVPGSAPAVLAALDGLGGRPEDVRQIVLTHSHIDHTGSAADLAAATGATVLAGAPDAPVIRGEAPEPPPRFTAAEQTLFDGIMAGFADAGMPEQRPVAVDIELHEGDELTGWGEPVHVLATHGHTPGGVALHLPESRVLFPGDIIGTGEGRAVLGPGNVDREQAIASFRRLAALERVEVVCVPHGDPVTEDVAATLAAATPETDWL